MSVLATIGVVGGLLSAGYGAYKSSKSAKEEKEAMAQQRAASQAWYDRNYYQDYLNTVEAQNAVKRYKDAWGERLSEERARQVISGGTPAQLAAVQEAGAEGMANLMGDLAATGEQKKQAVDAQKLAMDNNMSEREMALARAKQEAGANLMQNGIGVAASSLQAFGTPKAGAPKMGAPKMGADVSMTEDLTSNFKDTSLGLPKSVEPINVDSYQVGLVMPEKKKYRAYEK